MKIPEKFNDLDIVSVSSDIFNSTLKTLDISKRVTHIDTQLVSNAVSLQEIRVAEKIRLMLPWMGCFLQKI